MTTVDFWVTKSRGLKPWETMGKDDARRSVQFGNYAGMGPARMRLSSILLQILGKSGAAIENASRHHLSL